MGELNWEAQPDQQQTESGSGSPSPNVSPGDGAGRAPREHQAGPTMPRALKNLDLSLGLASIPVQLFTAASGQGIAFQLLHARCGSRLQTRLECPLHGVVPRDEIVKGYEYAKDDYVAVHA